ncbi:MAG: hypothetical protein ACOVOR_02155 [Rhabdochlamydiaceae bacterium]
MKKIKLLFIFFLITNCIYGNEDQKVKPLFDHELNIQSFHGKNDELLIMLHGYQADWKWAKYLHSCGFIEDTILGFNFPDHDCINRKLPPESYCFGTIEELLPAFFVLKQCVIDQKKHKINICGFSAGGGALINILSILNSHRFEKELQQIGINAKEKKEILSAIQEGIVVLEVPLKSIEEIIEGRGSSPELKFVGDRYKKNKLVPIENVKGFKGLKLKVIVYLEENDPVVFNRDDDLLIERLRKFNSGITFVVKGKGNKHADCHKDLWSFYALQPFKQRINPHFENNTCKGLIKGLYPLMDYKIIYYFRLKDGQEIKEMESLKSDEKGLIEFSVTKDNIDWDSLPFFKITAQDERFNSVSYSTEKTSF